MSAIETEATEAGPGTCERCGEVHKACHAHRANGKPCGMSRMRGLEVCYKHGGATPVAREKSRRFVEWQAQQGAFQKLGVQADVKDPAQAIMSMVREAAGNVAFYRWRVQQLSMLSVEGQGDLQDLEAWLELSQGERDALARDVGSAIALRVDPSSWRAEMHVLVKAYDRERDTLVKYSKLACDAGVQERLVRAVEQDAQQLVRVIRHVLDGLGLSPEQVEQGRSLLREALEQQAQLELSS